MVREQDDCEGSVAEEEQTVVVPVRLDVLPIVVVSRASPTSILTF